MCNTIQSLDATILQFFLFSVSPLLSLWPVPLFECRSIGVAWQSKGFIQVPCPTPVPLASRILPRSVSPQPRWVVKPTSTFCQPCHAAFMSSTQTLFTNSEKAIKEKEIGETFLSCLAIKTLWKDLGRAMCFAAKMRSIPHNGSESEKKTDCFCTKLWNISTTSVPFCFLLKVHFFLFFSNCTKLSLFELPYFCPCLRLCGWYSRQSTTFNCLGAVKIQNLGDFQNHAILSFKCLLCPLDQELSRLFSFCNHVTSLLSLVNLKLWKRHFNGLKTQKNKLRNLAG